MGVAQRGFQNVACGLWRSRRMRRYVFMIGAVDAAQSNVGDRLGRRLMRAHFNAEYVTSIIKSGELTVAIGIEIACPHRSRDNLEPIGGGVALGVNYFPFAKFQNDLRHPSCPGMRLAAHTKHVNLLGQCGPTLFLCLQAYARLKALAIAWNPCAFSACAFFVGVFTQ